MTDFIMCISFIFFILKIVSKDSCKVELGLSNRNSILVIHLPAYIKIIRSQTDFKILYLKIN